MEDGAASTKSRIINLVEQRAGRMEQRKGFFIWGESSRFFNLFLQRNRLFLGIDYNHFYLGGRNKNGEKLEWRNNHFDDAGGMDLIGIIG